MQLPVRGKFEEAPGWAMRWAGGGTRVLQSPVGWSRGRVQFPSIRRTLSGYIPRRYDLPGYYDYSSPVNDFALFRQYASQYAQQSEQYALEAVEAVRSLGYELVNLTQACDTSTGCFPAMYAAVMVKDGRQLEVSIGNPYDHDSPQQEAQRLHSMFSQYSTPVAQAAPVVQQAVPVVQQAAPVVQQATTVVQQPAPAAASYQKSVSVSAPDGYFVGGRFTVKIYGRPNSTVQIRARQNGQDHGTTTFGTTNSSGYYEISGVWGPEHEGNWDQWVYVGAEEVGRMTFSLSKKPSPPGNVAPAPSTPSVAPEAVAVQTQATSVVQQPMKAEVSVVQQPVQSKQTSIPMFAVLAAGGLLLLLMAGRK